jgi:hypothetical protein
MPFQHFAQAVTALKEGIDHIGTQGKLLFADAI